MTTIDDTLTPRHIVVVREHTEDGAFVRYAAGPFDYVTANEVYRAAKPNDFEDWEGYGWSTEIELLYTAERFLSEYAADAAERRELNPTGHGIEHTGEDVL